MIQQNKPLSYAGSKPSRAGLYLFAIPWLVFGFQHYIYADFVATLVPAFMPGKIFWVYLTGTAMIAAGISLITNIKLNAAAMLLAIMLVVFILLIHVPKLTGDPLAINYTRAFQDTALAGAAFMLTRNSLFARAGLLLYAAGLTLLGFQHFMHVAFITAKVPPYFPLAIQLDYVIGAIMILASIGLFIKQLRKQAAVLLGALIGLFAVLLYLPGLVGNVRNGQLWTGFMLELALCAGALITMSVPLFNNRATRY